MFEYQINHEDSLTAARAGTFVTPHGAIQTPTFMPVGTRAALKGVTTAQVADLNAQVLLANTYHLNMRPGHNLIKEAGGLHTFMNWHRPILTDSGGFQIFSLSSTRKIDLDAGVTFKSVYDGQMVSWTPEFNMEIQNALGADIIMQLDQCMGYPAIRREVEASTDLSARWAERCLKAHKRPHDQALFGIVQGGMHLDLRINSLKQLMSIGDFPGFGIGGYSVGEDHEVMFETLAPLVEEEMPKDKPRYLMGVGNPTTLVRAVGHGVDLFDCVLPTRTARTGTIFSSQGRINLRNACHKSDFGPLDPACSCPACQGFSRAYVHHLIKTKEMVGLTLCSIHNLHYLIDLMRRARLSIEQGQYRQFIDEWMQSPAAQDY